MSTLIYDTTTGRIYPLDEFGEQAAAIYDGDEECVEAARSLVDTVTRHEYYQGFASFLAVEVHADKTTLACWAKVVREEEVHDVPVTGITGRGVLCDGIAYILEVSFEGSDDTGTVEVAEWPDHDGYRLTEKLGQLYGGSWRWVSGSSLEVTR